MQKFGPFCILFLVCTVSCGRGDPDTLATTPHQEIVHSISAYDIEFQDRALDVAEEMMSHWPAESYLRWRPVRVEPSEVLQEEIFSDNAMPASLQLTFFPDMIVNAQRKRYRYIEATGDAIWEGVIPGFELSGVEITIVDTTDKLANTEERIAFVIRVWNPPRHLYIFPTDDLDVYVAIEGSASDDTNVEWAPNN